MRVGGSFRTEWPCRSVTQGEYARGRCPRAAGWKLLGDELITCGGGTADDEDDELELLEAP